METIQGSQCIMGYKALLLIWNYSSKTSFIFHDFEKGFYSPFLARKSQNYRKTIFFFFFVNLIFKIFEIKCHSNHCVGSVAGISLALELSSAVLTSACKHFWKPHILDIKYVWNWRLGIQIKINAVYASK